jgi:1-acyl-sn-glycerol-3-phosphate acyltransferase
VPIKGEYHVAWWRRWLTRPIVRFTLRIIFLILSPVKITGRKNIPLKEPYIVAINHVSLFEAPFIGSFWPEQLEVIGASDVWERPGQNILARMWGGIQVHRGDYDRAAIESVISALRSGHPLLIAPEGQRSHVPGLRQAKTGIAFIVANTGIPVIPVGIIGTTDDYWNKASKGERPQLEMHIGKPIRLPPSEGKEIGRHQSRQYNSDLIMRHIAGLLPEAYRGIYAESVIFPEKQG